MANNTETFDPKTAIYTPAQVSQYGLVAVNNIEKSQSRGVPLGIEQVDGYFAPALPGQVVAIIAQTSHYKSGLMHSVEHSLATKLTEEGRAEEIIVHISVEESVEEQAYLEYARHTGEQSGQIAIGRVQDWERLRSAATIVSGIPIYRIGDSLARADDMPNLYLSNMIRCIDYLQNDLLDWKPKIAALFFDYLQAFPIDPEVMVYGMIDQRRLQVRSDIYRLRLAAAKYNCPVFVAVQGKQTLSNVKPPVFIPGMYDGEESSSIAQRCDRILTLWMPAKTGVVGDTFEFSNRQWTVGENMLWIKVAKQRGGLPSGRTFPCRVDFTLNTIAPDPDVYKQVSVNRSRYGNPLDETGYESG
jgi:replicative DNA helicase